MKPDLSTRDGNLAEAAPQIVAEHTIGIAFRATKGLADNAARRARQWPEGCGITDTFAWGRGSAPSRSGRSENGGASAKGSAVMNDGLPN